MIMVFNRIMWNTVEQTIIFVCLLWVVQNKNPFDWPDKNLIHIVRMFIFSRVVYSATYILGQVGNMPNSRRFGFVGTLTSSLCLLLALLGINIFKVISIMPVPKI